MTVDYEYFKNKLLDEKKDLEAQLEAVGKQNPNRPSDWTATPTERDISLADENTVADSIEDFEEANAIVNTLETRYRDIFSGLDKIKHGVYGTCQVCGKEIEKERLEANPAARTCMEHTD